MSWGREIFWKKKNRKKIIAMKRKDYIKLIKKDNTMKGSKGKFRNYMKHASLINTIADVKNNTLRKKLVAQMPPGAISGFQEVIRGVLSKDIPITAGIKKKLRRHEKIIKTIAGSKSKTAVKKAIGQKGGFILGPLVPLLGKALAPLAGQLLGGLFK